MTDCYVDSSALVKNYVREAGSDAVRELLDPRARPTVTIVEVTPVEVVAAFMRCARRGDVSRQAAEALADGFLRDVDGSVDVVPISGALVGASLGLARSHVIRAYDALQLAAALATNQTRVSRGLPPVLLVSADRELNVAARAEGMEVLDPTQ